MCYLCSIKCSQVYVDHTGKVEVTDEIPQFAHSVSILNCSDREDAYDVAKDYIREHLTPLAVNERFEECDFSISVVNFDADPNKHPLKCKEIDTYMIDLVALEPDINERRA